jgi:integrase
MARGDGSIVYEHRAGTDCRDARQHRGCTGRWRGVASVTIDGKTHRPKVDGSTKTEAAARLRTKVDELRAGVRADGTHTVRQCCEDWLALGLSGRAPKTISTNTENLAPVLALIGNKKLAALTVADVERMLRDIAKTRSTRTVQAAANALERAIQRAVKHRTVSVNVAALADRPHGQAAGRPSKAMTRAVLDMLLTACETDGMVGDYAIVAAMTGCRPEELRALTWSHVDLKAGVIAVWRSDRHGGDTKTRKSRRTLAIPQRAVQALTRQHERQQQHRVAAAELWQGTDLVFSTSVGTMVDPHNLRRDFRKLCRGAGIGGNWSPREMRHTFVSIMSEAGVPIEEIARLAGHSSSVTTERIYRRELRPTIGTGATIMDSVFPVSSSEAVAVTERPELTA